MRQRREASHPCGEELASGPSFVLSEAAAVAIYNHCMAPLASCLQGAKLPGMQPAPALERWAGWRVLGSTRALPACLGVCAAGSASRVKKF